MTIEKIYLGEVDSKNELLKQKRVDSTDFFDSFSMPRRVNLDDYLTGQKYYIYGLKGTGKTALLRYLHDRILREGKISEVILFKSHVSEEDRQGLSKGAGFQILSIDGTQSFTQDFKESWKWMIFQKLAEKLQEQNFSGPAVERLYKLTGTQNGTNKGSLGALFSKISAGKLRLSGEALGIAIELGIEGEKKGDELAVSPASANRLCAKILNEIDLGAGVYLLFDELELVHQTPDQFDRDRRIIRDLIYTISHINADSAESGRPLYLISTLRTEVLHSILGLGHEIGKDVDDFGEKLDWSDANEGPDHPLLKLIGRKMAVSTQTPENEVWQAYFPEKINNQDYYRFILTSSYYRPRDIVRLLRVARSFNEKSQKFTTEHFDKTSLEFSKQTWLEITEELLASYTSQDVESLQRFFLGFNTLFFKRAIESRLKNRYSKDVGVTQLFERKGTEMILSDLFRIGVVGNNFSVKKASGGYEARNRWIFRGNTALNDAERMQVHKSLWKHLSLVPEVAKN